jgi:hypothetical protein
MTDELRELLQDIQTKLAVLPVMQAQLAALPAMRAQLNGLPLIHRALGNVQHDIRMLRAAVNEFALTNVTKGEIQALHDDVDRVMATQLELESRVLTVEQRLDEQE